MYRSQLKTNIINKLKILQQYYNFKQDKWRSKAYENAILAIQKSPINSVEEIRGVGKAIGKKIREYIDTGKIKEVEKIQPIWDSLGFEIRTKQLFRGILGVGEVRAQNFWDRGFRSLGDIRNIENELTTTQKIGLKYYEDLQKPVPRDYIQILGGVIRFVLGRKFGLNKFRMVIMCS